MDMETSSLRSLIINTMFREAHETHCIFVGPISRKCLNFRKREGQNSPGYPITMTKALTNRSPVTKFASQKSGFKPCEIVKDLRDLITGSLFHLLTTQQLCNRHHEVHD